jgi:hypothetical protein
VARREDFCRAWWGGWDSNPRPRDYEVFRRNLCAIPSNIKGYGSLGTPYGAEYSALRKGEPCSGSLGPAWAVMGNRARMVTRPAFAGLLLRAAFALTLLGFLLAASSDRLT